MPKEAESGHSGKLREPEKTGMQWFTGKREQARGIT